MVGIAIDLPVVELDGADRLVRGAPFEACRAQSAVAAVLLVLLEPGGYRGRRNAAIGFLLEPRCDLLERVAEIIVGERRKDHAQGIGLVAQRSGAGREGAFARGAAPQLHDLKLLFPRATARERRRTRGMGGDIRLGYSHRIMQLTEIERRGHGDQSGRRSRILMNDGRAKRADAGFSKRWFAGCNRGILLL